MELALEGWAVAGWKQVGKGLHPGCGGLLRLLLLYLFIFRRFLGGVATGAGRKGWEGGETGREGRGLCVKRLKRAGGDRAGRQAQGCAGPASAEGRRPPPRLESPCSVRPGSPGLRESARGAAGEDFARRGAPRVARSRSCPGRGAESAPRGPVQRSALRRVSSPAALPLPTGVGGPGQAADPQAPHPGPRFCPTRDPVLRGAQGCRREVDSVSLSMEQRKVPRLPFRRLPGRPGAGGGPLSAR